MRTCVLHVGMAKTGSTSIQATLAALPPSPDFVLLQSGEANAARALSAAFMLRPERFRPNRKRGHDAAALKRKGAKALKTFDEQLEAGAPLAVLSSEMLPGFDVDTLAAMRDWLQARFDRIRVLAYVREPVAYMESMVQQSLKNGNHDLDLERRYPSYREHFANLEAVFGADALEYRLFDARHLLRGCVVQDFASVIGLSLPDGAVVRLNEGLSCEAVGLLLLYRRQFPQFGRGPVAMRRNRALISMLSGLTGRKLRLSPQLLRPVIERHQDDLAWMSGRLGVPIEPNYGHGAHAAVLESVDDLSEPSSGALAWFAGQSGEPTPHLSGGGLDAVKLAQQIRRHIDRLVAERYGAREPVACPRLDVPGLLQRLAGQGLPDLADEDAIAWVQAALEVLGQELASCAEPTLVEGLGTFWPASDQSRPGGMTFVPLTGIPPSEVDDIDDDQ